MSATTPASPTPYISANCLVVRPNVPSVSTLPMSPMCWLIQASRPDARQKVFFSSPPTAMLGAASKGGRRGGGGEARGAIEGEAHGEGGVAPAAPNGQDLAVDHAQHRVVAGGMDGAVVDQPRVTDGT